MFNLPPIKYVFFNTGLEMEATKRHVKETAKKYGVEIEKVRAVQCPHIQGKLSVILPEDMIYIVTEDGIPVGSWNPVTNTYSELDAAVMPVVGRRVK